MEIKNNLDKSILLVEDDFITVKLIENLFDDICNIENAINAKQAIKMAKSKNYDAIIMDINLGKSENGMFATREIRKLDNYKNTAIIALTAFTMMGDKEEFLKGGCTHYVPKPIEINPFIDLIKGILGID